MGAGLPSADEVPAHQQTTRFTVTVHFPEHEPRHASAEFHATRHHLIDVLGVGCWIGGATKSQIAAGLPKGHRCYGATQLEAHHDMAEWAEWNGLDWRKFAADFPQLGITDDATFRAAAESENGILVLCDKHHRAKNHGIHMTDYPSWKADRYANDDWEFLPDTS